MQSKLQYIREYLKREKARNSERLNRCLTFWERFVVRWSVFFAQVTHLHDHPALEPEMIKRANQQYAQRFPSGLAEKTEEALFKTKEYKQKIET